ncbi:MAG: NAD(P)H-binding protein, partial [Chryseobacterium sp.]|nr:NAD(P)H-binding protein [Chryseobacterium sp.]
MRILLTGVTGYIGKRLLIQLLDEGHHIICAVREIQRFNEKLDLRKGTLEVIHTDFLLPETLENIPENIDVAYYLIHSMSTTTGDFEKMEEDSAINFKKYIEKTNAKQVIFLTGIVNNDNLSKHLSSRKKVEETLASEKYALTALRAGIIVGSG